MSECVVFDTSVLVDHLRTGCHALRLANLNALVRNSSVVLAELWRGATSPADQHVLRTLERNYLHLDLLIALTARSYGAKLIASNRGDFELIRSYRDFELEIWPA
jgi:predicted nucleic acid-binding protein